MRLLLDTHAFYWYIEGDKKLSGVAQGLIQDLGNEVLISPASYWEIAIKGSLGKWTLNRPYEEFVELALNQYGFRVLPILPTHTACLIGLAQLADHKDPFDRMLVAQAMTESISIVSADLKLAAYEVQRLW